jgi:hypothetical protein
MIKENCKFCNEIIKNPRENKLFCSKKCADKFHAKKNYYLHRKEKEFMNKRKKITKKWIKNNRERFNKVMLKNYHRRKDENKIR